MLSLQLPDDDAGTVFAACANRTKEQVKRATLLAQRPHVEARAGLYREHAAEGNLHKFEPEDPIGIDADELSGLYARALVKGGERTTYLRLKSSAPYGRCPLCAQRDVKTLDHYLSKDDYPELSVYPGNLVPSCSDCNQVKGTYLAKQASHRLFHPYYDDWSAHRLLRASVMLGDGVTMRYSIRAPEDIDIELVQRARRHFDRLALATLYEQHAAIELVGKKQAFKETFDADGAEGLRDDLDRQQRSWRRHNLNGWQSALFSALAGSDAFCEGGFLQIEDP